MTIADITIPIEQPPRKSLAYCLARLRDGYYLVIQREREQNDTRWLISMCIYRRREGYKWNDPDEDELVAGICADEQDESGLASAFADALESVGACDDR